MKIEKKEFITNLGTAFLAQGISFSAGLAISFLTPKVLGVEKYGYWQLFLFYVEYVNALAFGLFEGMYLKLGGKKYDGLDHDLIGSEWKVYVLIEGLIACILAVFVYFSNINADRKFILFCCCICIVIINSNDYLGSLLQAVNRTKVFSVSVIIYNLLWFIAVAAICFFNFNTYKIIVIMYVCGHVAAGIYLMSKTRETIFAKKDKKKLVLLDMQENVKIGVKLFLASYASSLIIGSVRLIVDGYWGIEIFGKVSFALSIAYFFLRFINQVGIVLFPALRRVQDNRLKEIYLSTNTGLSTVLPAILLLYIPIKMALSWWLPQYSESLIYLGLLLPICVFDGKMQLLYDTYYKVLREEKRLMLLNISTMVLSVFLTIIGIYVLRSILAVIVGIVISIGMRSVRANIFLAKRMKSKNKNFYQEIILVSVFMLCSYFYPNAYAFLLYGLTYIGYLVLNRKKFYHTLAGVRGFLSKEN